VNRLEQKITVTKLDAARRQLRTAIDLWFAGSDPVAIHTLAFAAYEIVHVLNKREGKDDLIFDSHAINDEHRNEVAKALKAPASFFKHANRDVDNALRFSPDLSVTFMIFSALGLLQLGESLGTSETAFMHWHYLHNPTWFKDGVLYKNTPLEALENLRNISRALFLQEFTSALTERTRS
jgi:hypothetical protein